MPLRAADVMNTQVVTVSPDDTLDRVARLMAAQNVSAVPVCDAAGQLVGILSEGDMMRPFGEKVAQKRESWLNMLAEGEKLSPDFVDYLRVDHHRVSEMMSTQVVTAGNDATLAQLADLMFERKVKRVPIVRDGKVVGMVSRGDIIRAIAHHPETFV